MKRFIKKILAFSIIPIIIGIPLLLLFVAYVNNLSSEYKLKSNIDSIFIGDSHIQQAINDNIVPNSLNLGKNSESFYFSYYKLNLLLNTNPSVKKVILGFSYHSLSNYYDRFIYGDYSTNIATNYFYILPPKEQFRMIYWNKYNLGSFIKGIIKQGTNKIADSKYNPYLGGFSNSFSNSRAVDSSMEKRILFQYQTNGSINAFSELNIEYFNKIVSLCKVNNIELYVLNTPLNNYYSNRVPKEYKGKLNELIHQNKLNYIDLSNLKLTKECYIPDGDHVSKLGAQFTSIELKNNIQSHNTIYKK
jgi:hypothetical protein